MAPAAKKSQDVVLGDSPRDLTVSTDLNALDWHKTIDGQEVLVSTRQDLIDLDYINASFESDMMPWAKGTSFEGLKKMIQNSITFGLYIVEAGKHKQIGMARLISDHVTFAYLTDVFVSTEYRRFGHARWLLACCRQVMESMPILRRGMLLTGLPYGEAFYKETLDFYNIDEEKDHLVCLTGRLKKQD